MKLKGNATGNKSQYTDEEKTLLAIAENMREISYIVNYLNDGKLYLYAHPAPFIRTRVPGARYLNYHMHNYFNNVYILKERMTAFVQRIKRSSRDIEIKRGVDNEIANIDQFFRNYGKIRNEHTHRVRYIDNGISVLETFEGAYASKLFNDRKLIKKGHVSMAYSEVKKSWLRFMKTSNISIHGFVSQYFDFITQLILDNNGSFRVLLRKYSYE
jgi:hypothetical protein